MKTGLASAWARLGGEKYLMTGVNILDQDLYQSVNYVQVLLRIIEATRSGFGVTLRLAKSVARVPKGVWTAV